MTPVQGFGGIQRKWEILTVNCRIWLGTKSPLAALALLLGISPLNAQLKWVEPGQAKGWVIEGKLQNTVAYGRLPDQAENKVRPAVWSLSKHCAGLKIRFWSNSPEIHLHYKLTRPLAMPHMPATGVSGFDLYRRSSEGKMHWVACSKPTASTAQIRLVSGLPSNPRIPSLYTLYLPLYNGVGALKIGVPEGEIFTPAARNTLNPIVVYGTSIAQGACATRPGLAWTNILERRLDWPVINLGFSGNGKMETEVADFFTEQDAAVYVIDCLPNLGAQHVQERIAPLLDTIRTKRPKAPILLVEEAPTSNFPWNPAQHKKLQQEWDALRAEFNKRKPTDKNLHYLTGHNLLGSDGEATVDNTHPNDLSIGRSPQEVSESIIYLTKEIKKRQPGAKLIVTGILPRKNRHAERVATNALLANSAGQFGFTYIDLDNAFPKIEKNGKQVIRGMAPDQLHPVAEGYNHLAERLKKIINTK